MATKKVSKKATTKAPAKATPKADNLPAELMADMMGDANMGTEDLNREDVAIPRLQLLQQLSPQCTKGKTEYNEKYEVGDVFNSVTQETVSGEDGISVVPISYRRAHIEWKLRRDGGGLVADHGTDSSVLLNTKKDDDFRDITPSGTQIVVTAEFFVFVVDLKTGMYTPAVISMSASQMKKAKRWNTMMSQFQMTDPKSGRSFTPATFARVYQLTSMPEQNDRGSWFGWDIVPSKTITDVPRGGEIYNAAKAFRQQVIDGEVKASPDEAPEGGGGSVKEGDDDTPM